MKLLLFFLLPGTLMAAIHPGFVSLADLCPEIRVRANYSTTENFTGSVVKGYKASKAYLAKAPAAKLCEVQKSASKLGYGLKIFDGYRPVKAVRYFQEWAKMPEDNPANKELYYPKYTRLELFEKGFIATQSTHSRGSAVDLTLYDLTTGQDVDMGSGFDYFDDLSHTDSNAVTEVQKKNRMLLKDLMTAHGFKNFAQEWWHYSFKPEPYPDRAFDFDVE